MFYKYPKHMLYEEIGTNQDLSYIWICSLSILYNCKFILMATSLGTNAVVVTRVHSLYCPSPYTVSVYMYTLKVFESLTTISKTFRNDIVSGFWNWRCDIYSVGSTDKKTFLSLSLCVCVCVCACMHACACVCFVFYLSLPCDVPMIFFTKKK